MNQNQLFLSVGIDVGADFSLMAVALPTQEVIGRPYKILHSNLNSLQGAVDRIRAMESQTCRWNFVDEETETEKEEPLFIFLDELLEKNNYWSGTSSLLCRS